MFQVKVGRRGFCVSSVVFSFMQNNWVLLVSQAAGGQDRNIKRNILTAATPGWSDLIHNKDLLQLSSDTQYY